MNCKFMHTGCVTVLDCIYTRFTLLKKYFDSGPKFTILVSVFRGTTFKFVVLELVNDIFSVSNLYSVG
jgi:hypothetical protein